ncbi:serine--tRNA synthetase-like protein Slimp [Palaemon carinicauda]|uniref:serine--tRNA synthetase-like protein Slimp n=1 Tax=Palaemon carinicauda TaxID=392227 RepID=UPI0035B5A0A4
MSRAAISIVCVTRHWKHLRAIFKRNSNVISPMSRFEYIHTQDSLYQGNRGSALHVSGNRGQDVFGVLAPYLDIPEFIQNTYKFENNIKLRKLNLDVRQLSELCHKLGSLRPTMDKLEGERTSISNTMKSLGKELKKDDEKMLKLRAQGKEIREKLKEISKEVLDLEDQVVLSYLELPNKLHAMTCNEDKILLSLFSKPCFKFKVERHEIIGKIRNELEFVECSPTAYYLKGRLALLELACNDYFCSLFKGHGFISHSNPDFAKGVVVEGSGISFSEMDEKVFMLTSHNADADPNSQYLVGGASLQAFVSYFTKQVIENDECLPQKLLAVGRNYSPSYCKNSGLFNCWQSTAVDGLILFKNDPKVEEMMINEILMAVVHCYAQLKIHFQIKQYGAHNLEPHESAALGVLLYSPITDMYWEVGRISVCGDYVSKRLLILQKITNSSASFVSMIHIRVCNVTHLLALIMENGQKESGMYNIPDALNKFMYI